MGGEIMPVGTENLEDVALSQRLILRSRLRIYIYLAWRSKSPCWERIIAISLLVTIRDFTSPTATYAAANSATTAA